MNTVGSGQYRYRVIEDWAKLPEGWQFGILVGVAVDSQDRVYVCHQRQDPPIIVFDRQGSYVCSWGTGDINEGHIMSIAPDDSIYLVDRGAHQALRLKLDGERLMELGRKGLPSDTGLTVIGGEPRRAAGPFNMPTRMFSAPSGDVYVSDGYRNARVHRFSTSGELISSLGSSGQERAGRIPPAPQPLGGLTGTGLRVRQEEQPGADILAGGRVRQPVGGAYQPGGHLHGRRRERVPARGRRGRRVAAHHSAGQNGNRSGPMGYAVWTPDLGGLPRRYLYGGVLGAAHTEVRPSGLTLWGWQVR